MSPDPKPGDTVRVTAEGIVTDFKAPNEGLNGEILVKFPDWIAVRYSVGPNAHSVEIIRAAYVDGGIYMDIDEDVFRYSKTADAGRGGWYQFSPNNGVWETNPYAENHPSQPLTRLDGHTSERQDNG